MAESFSITSTEGKILILHLSGGLDHQTHPILLEAAGQAYAAGTRFLLLDLQQVKRITSAGLGALQHIFKLFTPAEEVKAWENEKHGEPYKSPYVKMAGASSEVYYILNVAGFLQNFAIYPDLNEALKSFSV